MRVAMFGLVSLTLGLGGIIALADGPSRPGNARDNSRPGPPATAAAPVVLRQTTFNIPFTINSNVAAPIEIQLYVSTDRGATWSLYDRAPSQSGHFPFRAARDGEYWFALKTIEERGQPVPRNPRFETGLRVLVDSTEPQLDFQARMGAAGEVIASWRASDATLVPGSFKIETRADGGGPWRQVAVDKQGAGTPSDGFSGQTTWWPETASLALNIRAEIVDKAANKTVVNRRLVLPRLAANRTAEDSRNLSEVPPDPYVTFPESAGSGIPWLPDEQAAPQADHPRNGGLIGLGQFPPVESEVRPPVSGATTGAERSLESNSPPDPYAQQPVLPAGERPRMTTATQFQLEYDVESVGPAGIAEVQLWGTRDGGRSWKLWLTDDDKHSPLDASVPAEGVYGFRVVVVGNNGLVGKKPAAGDLADLWIGVDTTPPTVRLTSAIYGEGRFAGQLDIRWVANDQWFSDRPVTIQFSENPQGPWSTIASGIPNTGQHYWSVEPRIPQKVYLRIEVRDLAGNVSHHQLTQPVSTTGLVPQGHIRGFRPASNASGAASRWRLF
ncbi:MAG: hypothetical protein ACC645_12270 [Pirellulales bacterium]